MNALSPAELSYLHTSLLHFPPIRPDGRSATQFRPLLAEVDILPTTNGSARVCFADGSEAIVGIKAEVERSSSSQPPLASSSSRPRSSQSSSEVSTSTSASGTDDVEDDVDMQGVRENRPKIKRRRKGRRRRDGGGRGGEENKGDDSWVELSVDIPSLRDDDALPVFLGRMLLEALLASSSSGSGGAEGREGESDNETARGGGESLTKRLRINGRFHWRLFIDVCSFFLGFLFHLHLHPFLSRSSRFPIYLVPLSFPFSTFPFLPAFLLSSLESIGENSIKSAGSTIL